MKRFLLSRKSVGVAAPAAPTPIVDPTHTTQAQAAPASAQPVGLSLAAPPPVPTVTGRAALATAAPSVSVGIGSVAAAPAVSAPVPGTSTTGFSANLETFPSTGKSYFALASQVGDTVANWANYPAVADVDVSGNQITRAINLSLSSDVPLVAGSRTVDVDGQGRIQFGYTPDGSSLGIRANIKYEPPGFVKPEGLYLRGQTGNYGLFIDSSGSAPSFGEKATATAGMDVIGDLSAGTVTTSDGKIYFYDASGEHLLESIDGNLYYDTELLAKAGDIQDIADWALYPALANVDLAGKTLYNAESVTVDTSGGAPVTLTTDASANLLANGQALASIALVIADISDAVAAWSTHPAVSAVDLSGNTIENAASIGIGATGANGLLTTDSGGTVLKFNDKVISTGSSGDVSMWATFPAVTTINTGGNLVSSGTDLPLTAVGTVSGTGAAVTLTADNGNNILTPGKVTITGQNGFQGQVAVVANPGASGQSLGGKVSITANGGSVGPIAYGGEVTIDANTGAPGDYGAATSAIKLSAAGINSYAGAIPSVGSLVGYNFMYGTAGINMCVTLPSVIPSIPGTLYMYAPGGVSNGGIRMESPTGVEMVNNTDFYAYRIYPYYNPFLVGTPPNLLISGRTIPLIGTQYVELDKVKSIGMDDTASISNVSSLSMNSGAISGVSTINGSSYPPAPTPPSAWSQYPATSNVDISGFDVSGVNLLTLTAMTGANPIGVSQTLDFSSGPTTSITAAGEINCTTLTTDSIQSTSSPQIALTSDISGNAVTVAIKQLITPYIASPVGGVDLCGNDLAGVGAATVDTLSAASGMDAPGLTLTGLTPFIVATDPSPLTLRLQATDGVIIKNNVGNYAELACSTISLYDETAPTKFGNILWNDASGRIVVAPNGTGANTVAYLSDIPASFRETLDIWVAPNGSDITGNGSQQKPFATIGQAITFRAGLGASVVTIHLASGTYTENPTLAASTYIVGTAGTADPATDPTIIAGTVTCPASSTGLIGLSVNGSVSATGVGNVVILKDVTINVTSGFGVSGNASVTMNLVRVACSGAGSGCVNVTTGGVYSLNRCDMTTSLAATNVVQATGTLTALYSTFTSTSASTSAAALVRFLNSGATTNVISFCRLVYTSIAVDVGGNKCCVQYANAGVNTTTMSQLHMECVGAVTGTPSVQCIQKTGVGAVNLTYGDLQAVGNAHNIAPAVTKTSMTQVP